MAKTRLPIWLLALFLAAFAIGTDDFVIAGILPELAADLAVSESAAGQLITVFSVTYAVAAPLAAVITYRWPRRTVMAWSMVVFIIGNLAAAAAPNYESLFGLRIVLAIAAATVTPAAIASAAAQAPPGKQGKYISVVAAGLTVSLAVGVPAGTWLGGQFGWRSTMILVAVLATVALIGMRRIPDQERDEYVPLRVRLAPLRQPAIVTALVSVLIAASGGLMFYEYVAPVTRELSAADSGTLGFLIAVAGISGAIGTWIGGLATDQYGPERTTIVSVGLQALAMLGAAFLAFTSAPGGVPVAVTGLLLAVWAMAGWAFNPAMYTRLINLSGNAGAEVAGLNNSALFFGISLASGLGGVVLASWGATAIPLVAGTLSLVAVAVFAVSFWAFTPVQPSPSLDKLASEAREVGRL